jgi:predicted nucleic acid-binding protein
MLKLIDSSTWIDYIRGIDNKQTKILHEEIENGGNMICLCPIIIQEVLQGFKDDLAYQKFKKLFLNINTLVLPEPEASIKAAEIYRTLRKNGISIRKINDCIIANYALEYNLTLIHNDADFLNIAKIFPLKF